MNKKTVIVTGGSRGIGRAIAIKFASNNYNIVINYKSADTMAFDIKKELEDKYNIEVLLVKGDLSNEDDIKRIVEEAINKFNRIDVLVNNAGICKDCSFEEKTKESFMNILDVNLIAPFLLCKYASKHLIDSKGSIINITSTNGIDSYYPESLDYDASKAGLINLTKNLAMYFAPNVRVNAVAPGWTETDMTKDLEPKYKKEEENNILLKRFASPSEIANVVYFLASDDASYINGEILKVDGGKNGY